MTAIQSPPQHPEPTRCHRAPSPPLAEHIGLLWYWRGHEQARSTERILPMPTMELVIDLRNDGLSGAGVSGPHSEAFFIERTTQDELLGIHFRPGGAFPFLGSPAGDLHNGYASLESLWGSARARQLLARLRAARSVESKFATLERWLLQIAYRPLPRHPAVAYALAKLRRDAGVGSAGRVAAAVNLSQRHFIELFRDQVGLTPKVYARIQRFQRLLDRVAHADRVDWLETALTCGYFDQSHFIHDFRAFTGLRPTEYWDLRIAGQSNHVRVVE